MKPGLRARARSAVARRLPPAVRRRLRPDAPAPRAGMVEEFRRRQVSGWVALRPGEDSAPVVLLVNGTEVARTQAAAPSRRRVPGRQVRSFRFLLFELWDHLGPSDRVGVAVDGRALAIAGRGTVVVPTTRGEKSWTDLRAALDDGWVFSRTGVLQRSRDLDTAWQEQVFGIADGVRDALRVRFDLDVFLTYGSLLGAVREGGVLAHDDDIDLGYLSAHTDPAAVGLELYEIARALIEDGWSVEPFGPVLHVIREFDGGVRERVDLFPHFFDADGLLHVPWGMAGTDHVHRSAWTGVHDVAFAGRTATVPRAAEAVLAQLYGATWRLPQPGFSWRLDRTESVEDAFMPRELRDDAYWRDFHRRTVFDEPSAFCRELLACGSVPPFVVDVGCGDGRDAVAFASAGHRVLALDRSVAALGIAGGRASDRLVVVDCDVTDPVAFGAALHDGLVADEAALFYLRFLLHSLTPDEERRVLDTIAAVVRPGDLFAAEFRDTADRSLPKNQRAGLRGFRDGTEVAAVLRDELGFTIEQADHATGRSLWGVEDPDLYRIIARR